MRGDKKVLDQKAADNFNCLKALIPSDDNSRSFLWLKGYCSWVSYDCWSSLFHVGFLKLTVMMYIMFYQFKFYQSLTCFVLMFVVCPAWCHHTYCNCEEWSQCSLIAPCGTWKYFLIHRRKPTVTSWSPVSPRFNFSLFSDFFVNIFDKILMSFGPEYNTRDIEITLIMLCLHRQKKPWKSRWFINILIQIFEPILIRMCCMGFE